MRAPKQAHFAFGGGDTCRWRDDGDVACWGYGGSGQLLNDGSNAVDPLPLVALNHIDQIAIGQEHACALSRGDVTCWGTNRSGQLGNGEVSSTATAPVRVRF